MQNIENNGKTLKDLQKFPDLFTFKIMGDNTNQFSADARKIFDGRNILPESKVLCYRTVSVYIF